jgi:hypothetical protein
LRGLKVIKISILDLVKPIKSMPIYLEFNFK